MMMSRLVWASALALLLFVGLIVTAPARLLGLVIPSEQLQLRGLSGTVWHGSASSALLHLPQGYLQLGAVEWSLRPASLLLLAPHITVSSEWGNQRFSGELIVRGQQDLDIINMEGALAADMLRHFAPVALAGSFSLQLEQLQLRDGLPHSVTGRLVWQNGAWQSPQGLVPLGSYALDVAQAPGEMLRGKVITLSGPLQANGNLELEKRHYAVDVLLESEASLDAQLQNMLSLIAVPENSGYRINLKGDF